MFQFVIFVTYMSRMGRLKNFCVKPLRLVDNGNQVCLINILPFYSTAKPFVSFVNIYPHVTCLLLAILSILPTLPDLR